MFEKILEKVLLTYFGRFISGLDKNNLKLGVWSGNVVIENVNLKQELIEILELPFKLKMSSVGRMKFNIPWKKLSSQPLEITMENVYVTVNPLPSTEWNFSDSLLIEKKL
jgi:vacuolar protein sorting-associated protein 13A/C